MGHTPGGWRCCAVNAGVSVFLQLIQNRTHLYDFLLLKMAAFQQWVLGLAQEARGSGGDQPRLLPGVIITCPLTLALQAGLALLWVPLWLLLWGPRSAYNIGLCCTRTVRLALWRLGVWEPLGLSATTFRDLVISCLHGLMLVALLMLLLTWRLVQKAHRFSLGWLPSQVGWQVFRLQVVIGWGLWA